MEVLLGAAEDKRELSLWKNLTAWLRELIVKSFEIIIHKE